MRIRVRRIINNATNPNIINSKSDLLHWLDIVKKEIALNESCNCRIEETEIELNNLYRAKLFIQKHLSKLRKKGEKT